MTRHIIEIVNRLINIDLTFDKPAYRSINRILSENKKLGSSDRFLIKTIFFAYLRNKLLIDSETEQNDTTSIIYMSLLFIDLQLLTSARKRKIYHALVSELESENCGLNIIAIETKDKHDMHWLSRIFSFKIEFISEIKRFYSGASLFKVLNILHSFSPTSIVVHQNHKFSKNSSHDSSLQFEQSEPFSDSYYYKSNIDLKNHSLYKEGVLEIQDVGSRFICELISPKANSKILDACCGAGGKSLTFSKLVKDQAEIISFDTNQKKLSELHLRKDRLGYKNITPVTQAELEDHTNTFDYVLVDAPCSGSGTIRRFPDKKYTITEYIIDKCHNEQIQILQNYSQFVKPGGLLFYSTCSIFEKENEMVAELFEKNNENFYKLDFNNYSNHDLLEKLIVKDNFVNIYPVNYDGDCFFLAGFQKGKN